MQTVDDGARDVFELYVDKLDYINLKKQGESVENHRETKLFVETTYTVVESDQF